MKKHLILVILIFVANFSFAQQSINNSEALIVAGYGWGEVHVGATREAVEAVLGKGEGEEGYKVLEGVYFREYPDKGHPSFLYPQRG
jgi:hypothetical protein